MVMVKVPYPYEGVKYLMMKVTMIWLYTVFHSGISIRFGSIFWVYSHYSVTAVIIMLIIGAVTGGINVVMNIDAVVYRAVNIKAY